MIIIDSNSLIVLVLGLIDPNLISKHKKTSIYEEQDFTDLLTVIKDFKNLLVLPNIWTEVDNLLNRFTGSYRYIYVKRLTELIKNSSEKYLHSNIAVESPYFSSLGITDSLILELAKECSFIVTSDSELSDYAIANGIKVYDMVKIRNKKFN